MVEAVVLVGASRALDLPLRSRKVHQEAVDRLSQGAPVVDTRALLCPEARSAGARDCPSMI